jgi:uncharacterized protein with beta-barrel porin domain
MPMSFCRCAARIALRNSCVVSFHSVEYEYRAPAAHGKGRGLLLYLALAGLLALPSLPALGQALPTFGGGGGDGGSGGQSQSNTVGSSGQNGSSSGVDGGGGGGGGAGTSGGAGGSGDDGGGSGGTGGAHALLIGSSGTNSIPAGLAPTTGGLGGAGAGNSTYGGGGGAGGYAVVVTNAANGSNALNVSLGNVTGAIGGQGGGAVLYSGTGGDGGYAIAVPNANSGTLYNTSGFTIQGGVGGAGGNATGTNYAGTGGSGGSGGTGGGGVFANGTGSFFTINNGGSGGTSTIVGGAGGNGGIPSGGSNTLFAGGTGGSGGYGGAGGSGISGNFLIINNNANGVIRGGAGGNGIVGAGGGAGSGGSGGGGAGGTAISGLFHFIDNAGLMTGGAGGTGAGVGNPTGAGGAAISDVFAVIANTGTITGGNGTAGRSGSASGNGGAGISTAGSYVYLNSGSVSGGSGQTGGAAISAANSVIAVNGGSVSGGTSTSHDGPAGASFAFLPGSSALSLISGSVTGKITVTGIDVNYFINAGQLEGSAPTPSALYLTIAPGFNGGTLANDINLATAAVTFPATYGGCTGAYAKFCGPGSSLNIIQSTNATLSGNISGPGAVFIANANSTTNTKSNVVVTFAGNDTYTGTTTINAGATLQLGDGIHANTIAIGNVTNYGMLIQSSTVTYSDALTNYGTFNTAGSFTGDVNNHGSFTIAPGAVWRGNLLAGAGGTIVDDGTWYVTNSTLGNGFALNGNQQNVAGTLNNTFNAGSAVPAAFVPVFERNVGGLDGNLPGALTQLDGEAATGAERSALQMTDQFLNLMLDPFVDGRNGAGAGGGTGGRRAISFAPEEAENLPPDLALAYAGVFKASPAQQNFDQRWTAWGAAYGGANTTSGDPVAGSSNVSAQTYGVVGGMDYRVTPTTVAGFALAGGGTNWSLAGGLGGGRSDALQTGVYGITRAGPAYLAAAASFTNHWFTTNRSPLGDQLSANFMGQSYGARVEAGYRYAVPPVFGMALGATPYAAVQAQDFYTPSYSESDPTGGGLGLSYNAMNATDTRSELGARFDDLTTLYGRPLILRSQVAWAHDWVSTPSASAVFQALPGASFVVNGAPLPADSALTTAGAELFLTAHWSVLATFNGAFANGSQTYAGSGIVRYTW